MTNLILDPAPGTTPNDGSIIKTDMHNEISNRLGLARLAANSLVFTDASGFFTVGTIANANVGASAAIAFSKLATLPSANILVGSAGAIATATAVTGDVTISNTGVTAIGAGKVTNTMLAGSITYSKLILTGAILNADLAGSIAYSKLVLTTSVVDGDISASAAISFSKLASLTSANILVGSAGNVATSVAVTGDVTITNTGVTAIGSGKVTNAMLAGSIQYSKLILTTSIVNGDISASAAIDYSKLAALTSANILVGSAGNVATSVAVTGDITITNAGVTAIGSNKVLDANIGSHTSTKITITAKGQLNSNIVYIDQANVFGAFNQTFKDANFKIVASADVTKVVTFDDSSMTTGITLTIKPLQTTNQTLQTPNITATDTVATVGFANIFGAGIKQTFSASASTAGFNLLTGITADPSSPASGDVWFRSDTGFIKYRTAATQIIAISTSAQSFTSSAGNIFAPTTTGTGLNIATGPAGSASEFRSSINTPIATTAFITTPQTGDYLTWKVDKATITNPSAGTIPNAATLKIVGAPIASTNVVITNKYALWVSGDNSRFDGLVILTPQTDPGATAGAMWISTSNVDMIKFSNASSIFTLHATKASGRSTGQIAAVASVSTYTVGSQDASFLVSANVLVTTSTVHSFTVTVTYTDEGNTSRVLTLNFSQLTGTFLTAITNTQGVGAYEGIPLHIRCKASTAITIATTGTFTTVTYNVEGYITQIG